MSVWLDATPMPRLEAEDTDTLAAVARGDVPNVTRREIDRLAADGLVALVDVPTWQITARGRRALRESCRDGGSR